MRKPVKTNLVLEEGIEALLAALKVDKIADACRILFINGDKLSLSAQLEQIGLVNIIGPSEGNIEGADLIAAQAKLQLNSIGKQVMPRMMNDFSESIVAASVEIASIQNEEERQSIMTAKIMEKAKGDGSKEFFKQITPYIGGAIKPLSEFMVGGLYKFLYDKYRDQSQMIPRFSDVVASLRRLGLASPFLSLALCPSCNNYEFIFSRSARSTTTCPKCGFTWPILIVHELTPEFAALKRNNNDLPVFISAYLKSKLPYPVSVSPNAEFNMKTGKIEVDVFIPDTRTGIECKNYINNITVADSTINTEVGKVCKQIGNYLSIGLKRVIVVTNFAEADANKFRVALKNQTAGIKGLEELYVLGSDINAFSQFLDKECEKIENTVNVKIQKELDNRVAKQLAIKVENQTSKKRKKKGTD